MQGLSRQRALDADVGAGCAWPARRVLRRLPYPFLYYFILLLSPKTALRMEGRLGVLASLLEMGKLRLREAARHRESITEHHPCLLERVGWKHLHLAGGQTGKQASEAACSKSSSY